MLTRSVSSLAFVKDDVFCLGMPPRHTQPRSGNYGFVRVVAQRHLAPPPGKILAACVRLPVWYCHTAGITDQIEMDR